jgi:tetratricopeptide (TPR) repeat protein
VHPSVRRELAYRLEKLDRERFLRLHRLAAEHCAAWISEYEEEEDVDPTSLSYDAWYRYEDPSWQAAKREWLYHQTRASSSGKDERELGRLRFTRVFLDAFWWWGCYLEFPFCRTLLEDWRMTQEDQDWTTAFTQLLDAYPHGYEKEKEAQDWRKGELSRWDAVHAALLDIREACGLSGNPQGFDDAERRHTRALIENFLAHAARYQSSDEAAYGDAVGHYAEAVLLFEEDNDAWDTAWTRFERSELHLEHGRVDEARADWSYVTELVPDLRDEELAANLHRLAADAHLRKGDIDAAFAAHGRAVLHAYLFQRRPHPPDEYTLAFYAEQVARALERLVEHACGGGDAARAAELLAAPFPGRPGLPPAEDLDALCRKPKPDLQTLSAALFPDPPLVDELHRRSSKFVQRWVLAESRLDLEAPTDLTASEW